MFPDVNVRDARKLRDEARQLLAAGIDPGKVRKEERIAQREEGDRREAAMRFMLDNDGALSFRLGKHCLNLTATEFWMRRVPSLLKVDHGAY